MSFLLSLDCSCGELLTCSRDFTKYFGSRGDREGAPDPKPGEAEPDGGSGGPIPGGIGPAPTAFQR